MLLDFAGWVATTPLSIALQQHTNLIAFLQAVHIVMIGLVFGSALLCSLHVLGRFRADDPTAAVFARFMPFLWGGFGVMAVTGLVLAASEPLRQANALSFWLKMALVAAGLAGVVALRRTASRPLAAALIVAWIAIVFLGRAIAYDTEVWGRWSLGA